MEYGIIKKFIAIILVSVLATFIVFAFLVVGNVREKLDEDIEKNLIEICTQGAQVIKNNLEVYENKVEVLSNMSQISSENISKEEKIEILREFVANNEFIRMGISDIYGNAYTTFNEEIDISQTEYYKNAINGSTYTTNIIDNISGSRKVVVHSSPIISKGVLIGVLFAETPANVFKEDIIPYLYKGEGEIAILDRDFNIILATSAALGKGKDEYIKSEEEAYEIENKIKLRQVGATKISVDNYNIFLGYVPIDIETGWSLVSTVRESVASSSTIEIVSYTIEIAIFLGVIFTILIILIFMFIKRSDDEINYLAFVDEVTEGRNYSKFIMDSNKILDRNKNNKYAFVYFDVDNFEIINETFGDSFGEIVLWKIAQILKYTLPNEAIYSRIHRDNFVYLTSYNNKEDVIELVKLITHRISELNVGNKQGMNTSIVSGIYFINDDNISLTSKINKANLARIEIKGNKVVKYNVFSEYLRKSQIEEVNITEKIKLAIKNSKLEVYYQPKIDVNSEKIVGCEALVRWKNEEGKFVSPEYFIPIAEKNGLIEMVDRWIFIKVCKDIREWKEKNITIYPISINLSRANLYRVDLIDSMDKYIKQYGVEPSLLEIEITETLASKDMEFIANKILEIKKLGIKVSMDDFGTGNSSLANLSSLPIDTIKLDRSFVIEIENNEKSRNIIRAIVYLAKSLNLNIVAEGVENEKQCEYLKTLGCNIIQGYYYAKPMDKEKLEKKFLT